MRYRTDEEIAQRLCEVETAFDLFAPTIDGWSAWQLLRFSVAMGMDRGLPMSAAPGGPSWGRSALLRKGAADWARYVRLPRAPILVKTFASALAETQPDGRRRDVFFDDVLDVVGPHVKLEVQNARDRAASARGAHLPPDATTVGLDIGARLLSRRPSTSDVSRVARRLSGVISTELGVAGFDARTVERRLLLFRRGRELYGWVLDRVRPRLVLVADTGEFELVAAAKQRDIRCIELQHGIFTRYHAHALGATAAAHREQVIVPDSLFLFGAYWEAELRAGGFYRDELVVTGSPRLDRFRGKGRREESVCRVLVTSQGIAVDELAALLAQTSELARVEGFDCSFDLKLHPIYDWASKDRYAQAFDGAPGVRILGSDQPPSTLELLSGADAHVSISSACHYESLGLRVPTVVVALPSHEEVAHLVEAGDAMLAATPAELLQHLRAAQGRRVPDQVSGRYYRPGALERIVEELGRTGE